MSQTQFLVEDAQLETHFIRPDYLVHTYAESGSHAEEQCVHREEFWIRKGRIASGSYGKVWLERCVKVKGKGGHGPVLRAVKEIDKPSRIGEHKLYKRELEAILKFSNRKYAWRFVESFGWYMNDQSIFIAMEYLRVGDLYHYFYDKPAAQESSARQIAFQMLEGLNFMHRNGFSHRDIKPSNILIKSCPPEAWWIKLGDFGISKRAADCSNTSTAVRGTEQYMSPELRRLIKPGARFNPRNTQAADMWAAGATMFWILTKEYFYECFGSILDYITEVDDAPSNILRRNGVSDTGIGFIKDLLRPQPENRCTAERGLRHSWPVPPHYYNTANETQTSAVLPLLSPNVRDAAATSMPPPSGRWDTVTVAASRPTSSITTSNTAQREQSTVRTATRAPRLDSSSPRRSSQVTAQHMSVAPAARYYVLKSGNNANIETSRARGIWSCNEQTNTRLSKAYKATRGPVFLIFSINGSREYCGVARMTSPKSPDVPSQYWVGGTWEGGFYVEWISTNIVRFDDVKHLKAREDGTGEIHRHVFALELCMRTGHEMMRRFGVSQDVYQPPLRLVQPSPTRQSTVGSLNISMLGLDRDRRLSSSDNTNNAIAISAVGQQSPLTPMSANSETKKRSFSMNETATGGRDNKRQRTTNNTDQFSFTQFMTEWSPSEEPTRKG